MKQFFFCGYCTRISWQLYFLPAEKTDIVELWRSTIPLVIQRPRPLPPPACNTSGLNCTISLNKRFWFSILIPAPNKRKLNDMYYGMYNNERLNKMWFRWLLSYFFCYFRSNDVSVSFTITTSTIILILSQGKNSNKNTFALPVSFTTITSFPDTSSTARVGNLWLFAVNKWIVNSRAFNIMNEITMGVRETRGHDCLRRYVWLCFLQLYS